MNRFAISPEISGAAVNFIGSKTNKANVCFFAERQKYFCYDQPRLQGIVCPGLKFSMY
ncbi:hypothetical protein Q4579_15055 [Photobacterium sp. 1_MG-2023]|nr:hypothetical protein [Photobacterium sp. 1_MG-2023]